jgi:hypothetical protein
MEGREDFDADAAIPAAVSDHVVDGRRRGGLVRVPLAQAAEGVLETTSVRIFANRPGICVAPQYIAEPLLRAEGFTMSALSG